MSADTLAERIRERAQQFTDSVIDGKLVRFPDDVPKWLAAFALSELSAAEQAERERCCKDVCAWCREPSVTYDSKAVQVHGTWKHRYNNGELAICRAAPIRNRE